MIQQYINSGILEAYVTGCASESEVKELLRMKAEHPEVNIALKELEADMEFLAQQMAVTPPLSTWGKISDDIDEIMLREKRELQQFKQPEPKQQEAPGTGPTYIEVEGASSHMRIHKAWRWVFAAVFILGKIFLGFAIYFYLENRQAQKQLQKLETEIQQLKR
ncbi:hypothetical protein D0C36_11180 [Mucilaginibacter conchicola]|uniref:Anti-sigma factor n=1 Tax=Mucilaginibacter conchicola TaxID=2303333 RepID=A0A372NS89_9SPHI|nr:hypothetical protein [Mucilaginibacter conchicola]RFZ92002.1 hypothetical protein D0C36_11180 [Mucilaginibacter conchicola]